MRLPLFQVRLAIINYRRPSTSTGIEFSSAERMAYDRVLAQIERSESCLAGSDGQTIEEEVSILISGT